MFSIVSGAEDIVHVFREVPSGTRPIAHLDVDGCRACTSVKCSAARWYEVAGDTSHPEVFEHFGVTLKRTP